MDKPPSRTFMRLQWRVHRFVWDLTGGRLGRRAIGMPVLELVTTGHKTGERRSILITYVEVDGGFALAGTNAGAVRDPAWITNLRSDPEARVRVRSVWKDVHARFLEGAERDVVWEKFQGHSGYADYERMIERPVPLVVLEPSRRSS